MDESVLRRGSVKRLVEDDNKGSLPYTTIVRGDRERRSFCDYQVYHSSRQNQ
jgi:hypothetical protein